MKTLNQLIQSERPSVSGIVDKVRSKEYFVDKSFQRRLVWTEKQKIRLIETILTNYPMPEIYLWQQPANPQTGAKKFSIVDGQQRITSIVQFVSNEFSLDSTVLDQENRSKPFSGKQFKDLSKALKTTLWDYVINVRQIPSNVSEKTIRNVFSRLNETDRSLNPQELRHAHFDGQFVKAAEDIAELDFWAQRKVFRPNMIRRMRDIEFASDLLHYIRGGVDEDDPETMNDIYDLYNDEYLERSKDFKRTKALLDKAAKLFDADSKIEKLFKSVVHLYSLLVVLDRMGKRVPKAATLAKFASEYAKKVTTDKLIEQYRKGASYGTRTKKSRLNRIGALEAWIGAYEARR